MGARDYYAKGQWNCWCPVCGFKRKSGEMRLRWDGVYVCEQDWEPRQPQDFVRGHADKQQVDFTLSENPDQFVGAARTPAGNIIVGTPTIYVNGSVVSNYSIQLPVGIITFNTAPAANAIIAWSGTWLDNANVSYTYTQRQLYVATGFTTVYQIYGAN